MRKLFVLLACVAGATFAAQPAQADPAAQYAACLVEMHPERVRALMQAPSAEAANQPYRSLSDDSRCFTRVFDSKPYRAEDAALSLDMLRGRLAEQALLAEGEQVEALQPLPLQQKRYLRPWFAATGRNPAVDEMGACMADTDPGAIMALIRTAPGSSYESDAIGAMSGSLTRCLSAGTRLDASRQALRAALADALYQRVSNPTLSLAKMPERGL
ncbi:MAG TPA: hypothetical protein VIV07_06605 [Sphingomicrobium sp.]